LVQLQQVDALKARLTGTRHALFLAVVACSLAGKVGNERRSFAPAFSGQSTQMPRGKGVVVLSGFRNSKKVRFGRGQTAGIEKEEGFL